MTREFARFKGLEVWGDIARELGSARVALEKYETAETGFRELGYHDDANRCGAKQFDIHYGVNWQENGRVLIR